GSGRLRERQLLRQCRRSGSGGRGGTHRGLRIALPFDRDTVFRVVRYGLCSERERQHEKREPESPREGQRTSLLPSRRAILMRSGGRMVDTIRNWAAAHTQNAIRIVLILGLAWLVTRVLRSIIRRVEH